jgi:hypothetical protein
MWTSPDWEFLLELGVLIWCGKKLRLRKLEKKGEKIQKDQKFMKISSGFEPVKFEVSF